MKARKTSWGARRNAALSDWRELQNGEPVNIVRNARVIAHGRVEEVSESGRVLWIMDGESETHAFLASDGVLVQRYSLN